MYYVYLLRTQVTGKYYVGSTDNPKKRLYSHNLGKNIATKAYIPWQLVYFEAYPTKQAALKREKVLKHHGRTLSELKRRIWLGRSPRHSQSDRRGSN